MTELHDLPSPDRPREKLSAYGARNLGDRELVALLLGSGTAKHPVLRLAGSVLEVLDAKQDSLQLDDLAALDGIGPAKAMSLLAALELARRRIRPAGMRVCQPRDVFELLRQYSAKRQEHFLTVTLNGANEVLAVRVITIGLLDRTHVHPREVFADAITDRAASIILAHNHPSGSLTPSDEDRVITWRLLEAGRLLGVPVLDHLIISERGFLSFEEAGLLVPRAAEETTKGEGRKRTG